MNPILSKEEELRRAQEEGHRKNLEFAAEEAKRNQRSIFQRIADEISYRTTQLSLLFTGIRSEIQAPAKRPGHQFTPTPAQVLEVREYLSAVVVGADFQSGTLQNTGLHAQETIFTNQRADVANGSLQMDESVLYVSDAEYIPSPDQPVIVEIDFKIAAGQVNGLVIATRSDGNTAGTYQTAFNNAMTFTVEPSGLGIYDYNQDGGERIGGSFQYFSPGLDPNKTYTLVVQDNGTSVSGKILDGDTVVHAIEGDTHGAIYGGKVVIRPQGREGKLTSTIDTLTISHGEEAVETSTALQTLYTLDAPLDLSQKTPHFFTDYVSATPENPVTANARFTFKDTFSYPSILIAQSETTDHRNGLREAIYVQLGRDGNGNVVQFLGSDANEQSPFTYSALSVGDSLDVEVLYDGTDVHVSLTHDGALVAQHTATPPIAYSSATIGSSNVKWDSSIVTATIDQLTITQGIEQPVAEPVAEEPVVTPVVQEIMGPLTLSQVRELYDLRVQEKATAEQSILSKQAAIAAIGEVNETVTPSFSLSKLGGKNYATLSYKDAEAGSTVIVQRAYGDSSVVLQQAIQGATGELALTTPDDPNAEDHRAGHYTFIDAPDGSRVYLGVWDTAYGKNNGADSVATMSDANRALLTHTNAEAADRLAQIATLEAEIAELQEQVAALDITIANLETNLNAAVHYNRLHVTGGDKWDHLNINYMTPADATEIWINVDNNAQGHHHSRQISTSHIGGKALGFMNVDLYNNTSTGSTITVSMLVDGQVVDRVQLQQQNSGITGGSSWEWGTEETGRNVENPIEPQMTVLRTSGPIITIAAQTPYNSTGITLDGGGFFGNMTINSVGGSSFATQSFVMNGDKPSGIYTLHMNDGYNGMELTTLDFAWDASLKTVKLLGDNPTITALESEAFDDAVSEAQRQADLMASLDSIDVSFQSLRQVQRTHLFEASVFPMTDAEKEAAELSYPIPDHPDRNAIFNQGLGAWEEAIGELLQYGVDAVVDAWNGDSQTAGKEYFDMQWDRVSIYPYLRELEADFGVALPSNNEIFDEAKRIAVARLSTLHGHQSKNVSMHIRLANIANMEGPESEREISNAAFMFNEGIVVAAHGEGSPEHLAYLESWGQNDGDTFAVAVDNHREYLATEYGEHTDEFLDKYGKYLDEVETQVLSDRSVEVGYVPTSDNTLIVLLYGSNQFPDQGVGFDNLAIELSDYKHVLPVSPGHNPFAEDNHFDPVLAFNEIQNAILNAIHENPSIKNISLTGYSWGGGMLYDVAEWMQNHDELKSIKIVSAAYVDAVELNSFTAENRIPPGVDKMINIFQSDARILQDGPLLLNGGTITNQDQLSVYQEIDMDEFGNFHTHASIDEASVPFIASFIKSIIKAN